MTKRAASVCMAILWIVPNAALFAYFSSIENQGFQVRQFSPELERNEFDQKIDGTILLKSPKDAKRISSASCASAANTPASFSPRSSWWSSSTATFSSSSDDIRPIAGPWFSTDPWPDTRRPSPRRGRTARSPWKRRPVCVTHLIRRPFHRVDGYQPAANRRHSTVSATTAPCPPIRRVSITATTPSTEMSRWWLSFLSAIMQKIDHFAFKHICVCVDRPSSRRCWLSALSFWAGCRLSSGSSFTARIASWRLKASIRLWRCLSASPLTVWSFSSRSSILLSTRHAWKTSKWLSTGCAIRCYPNASRAAAGGVAEKVPTTTPLWFILIAVSCSATIQWPIRPYTITRQFKLDAPYGSTNRKSIAQIATGWSMRPTIKRPSSSINATVNASMDKVDAAPFLNPRT